MPSCDTLDDPADQQPSPTSGILTEEEDDDEDHEAGGHEGEEEISLDEPLGDLDRELRKPARVTPRLASVAGGASDWWAVRYDLQRQDMRLSIICSLRYLYYLFVEVPAIPGYQSCAVRTNRWQKMFQL